MCNNRKRAIGIVIAFCLLTVIVYFVYVFVPIEIPIPFVGAIGNPRIENSKWHQMIITYKVDVHNQNKNLEEIERSLVVSEDLMSIVQKVFIPRQVKGWSFGVPYSSKVLTSRGEWYFVFETPRELYFSRVSDTDYAYQIILNNSDFYKLLKTLCVNNERNVSGLDISQYDVCLCRYRGNDQ